MRTAMAAVILGLGLAGGPVGVAVGGDDRVEGALKEAREKFAAMRRIEFTYAAKNRVAAALHQARAYRGEVDASVRNLRITVDGFGPRHSNYQKAAFASLNADLLAMRRELAEVDRRIEALEADRREVDEQALAEAASAGRRPGPTNRVDLLAALPAATRECRQAFSALRDAAASAGGSARAPGQVVREANAALNRIGEGDAVYGPPADFLRTFDQFQRSNVLDAEPAKGRPDRRRRR